MYPVSEGFLSAVTDERTLQHIRGSITDAAGNVIPLGDGNLQGTPRVETQCVSNAETFGVGEMYIGIAEVVIGSEGIRRAELYGGTLTLETGVEVGGRTEWVPLGVWDISSAERSAGDTITVKGMDVLARLKCSIPKEVGVVVFSKLLRRIEALSGVTFAQSAEEIAAIAGRTADDIRAYTMPSTCWDAVRMIAQYIGGFAFANREGKVEFRRYSKVPCLTVTADKRHSINLAEYDFSIGSVSFTDSYGSTVTQDIDTDTASSGSVDYSGNLFFLETKRDFEEWYKRWTDPTVEAVTGLKWRPGTVDYYGNPALDPGDMVALTGGINGAETVNFLICASAWQFRGAQRLTAPGVGTYSAGSNPSGGGGSSSGSGSVNIDISKTLGNIYPDKFLGEISGRKAIVQGGFSAPSAVSAALCFNVVVYGTEDSVVRLTAYLDGVTQTLSPMATLAEGHFATLGCTIPLDADIGTHTVVVEAYGEGEITDIEAFVWGQELTERTAVRTESRDYSVADNTITDYRGSSNSPLIPAQINGSFVRKIGDRAFSDSDIELVGIPEGIEEIGIGAFEGSARLYRVDFPVSVRNIGANAFAGTALRRVYIAEDCTYDETAFPPECEVLRIDTARYMQLYDKRGYAVLDSSGARIHVKNR